MIRKTLPLLILIVYLAGCTMAPTYTRPEAPVPAAWPTGPAYKAANVTNLPTAANVTWKDFFTNERLQKVIALALTNNRDLRVAALNVEKTQAQYRIQRSELFPTINAGGSWYRERRPADIAGAADPVTINQYSVNLGMSSWELDFFGRIQSLKDRALEQYLATEQARRGAQISLVAAVANAWLTLAADRETGKLAQSTLGAQEASYNLIRRRYELGASSELDLRQAQTRVEAARVDIAKYTGLSAVDENALNQLVGSAVPADLLPDALSAIKELKGISPGLPSDVLQLRPDILQAENQLKAANANIGAARAAFFPRITLTTSIGTESVELANLFKAGSDTWIFSPQIILPIFDFGSRWANLNVAKADRDIAVAQYEKAIQSAFREVADALSRGGTLSDQIKAQESLVHAAAESYRFSDLRYTKGIDGYLSVLISQTALYSAQEGLIALRLAQLNNMVAFYKSLGGGE
jgi:outer membrane protein, multidrug efflux system